MTAGQRTDRLRHFLVAPPSRHLKLLLLMLLLATLLALLAAGAAGRPSLVPPAAPARSNLQQRSLQTIQQQRAYRQPNAAAGVIPGAAAAEGAPPQGLPPPAAPARSLLQSATLETILPQQAYRPPNQEYLAIPGAAVVVPPLGGSDDTRMLNVEACTQLCGATPGCDYVWFCSEQVRASGRPVMPDSVLDVR